MAERLYGFGISPSGSVTYTAKIYDSDFSGTATEFNVSKGGINIEWDSNEKEDRHAPILGSQASVNMLVEVGDTVLETFLEDLRTGIEGRFWLEIVSTGAYTTVWRGIIIAENSWETDQGAVFEAKISAVDGIALLKKTPYLQAGALWTGSTSAVTHITRCLAELPNISMWGSGDDFIETSVDWWATGMTPGGANDALKLTYIDSPAFYDYHTKGDIDKDVLTCFDVVKNIVTSFGCRIYQLGGVFRIEQISYRANSSYEYRRYSKSGTFLSNSSRTGVNTINQTRFGAKLTYVTYDYIPQISKAKVTYKSKLRRNFWGNVILTQGSTFNFDQLIDSNSGAATFRVKGIFTVNVKRIAGYTGNPQDMLFAEMQLALKLGSNYLKRTGTYSNFAWHPNVAEWTASAGDKCSIVSSAVQVPQSAGLSTSFYIPFEFITPPLPSDAEDNSVSAAFFQLKRNNNEDVDESEFTITWTAGSMYMEVYDLGTPDVQEDEVLYVSDNPDGGTNVYEVDVLLGGNAASFNYAGRLMNSSNTQLSAWAAGTDTPDTSLTQLLADTVVNGQLRAIKRLTGTIFGTLDPMKLLRTSEPLDWMVMRLSWSLTEDLFNGSWFEVDYGTTAVPATPIKVKIIVGGTNHPQIPGPSFPGPTGNGNQGFASNSPGVVLAPIAFNTISVPITAGVSISAIDLTVVATGDEFVSGDTVTLVHPITGKFQNFAIDTAPIAGDTALSIVAEVADFDAPVGCFLVVKQKAFAFSLPKGLVGQILRHNGTRWAAYSGSTDGHVLTWDTTNGWQAEAPSGGGGVTDLSYTGTSSPVTLNSSTGTDVTVESGTGISLSATGSALTITNSAPDQTVSLTEGAGIDITGTYPNFTIAATGGAVADGDYGDITVTSSGTVWNIDAGVVGTTELADNAVTGAKIAMGSDAAGDIIQYNGTDYARLAIGTALQQLRVNAGATALEYFTVTASGDILNGGNTTGAVVIVGTNDNNAFSLETNNVVRLTLSSGPSTGGDMTLEGVTANTNTVQERIAIKTNSTGVAAAGLGGGIGFYTESTTTNDRLTAELNAYWLTATDASRDGEMVIRFPQAGTMRNAYKFGGANTGFSIFNTSGAGPVIITTTSLTHNAAFTVGGTSAALTVGGSTGTVAINSNEATSTAITIAAVNNTGSIKVGTTSFSLTTLAKKTMYFGDNYTAASGTGTLTALAINNTYNLTGTASGVQLGIDVAPTLTSLTAATYTGIKLNFNHASATGIDQIGELTTNRFDGRVFIERTTAGTGSNNAFLNLNGGAITGDTEVLRASANISTELIAVFANARNLSSTGDTRLELQVGGTSAGDPYLAFVVPSGTTTVVGVDNSDGDKFKITPGGTKPGSVANKGVTITTDAATLVGINKDAPAHALDVVGRVKASTGFAGTFAQWVAGNIAFGTGAGTGPVLNSISGTDNALYVSFTTGTAPTNNAIIFTGTYPNAWPSNSFVTFSADGSNNGATDITKFRTGGRTASKFDFVANGTLTASTNYQFCFSIFGS